jgi:hypothetical protein
MNPHTTRAARRLVNRPARPVRPQPRTGRMRAAHLPARAWPAERSSRLGTSAGPEEESSPRDPRTAWRVIAGTGRLITATAEDQLALLDQAARGGGHAPVVSLVPATPRR